jgi:probable Rubsico expression protein CbbX
MKAAILRRMGLRLLVLAVAAGLVASWLLQPHVLFLVNVGVLLALAGLYAIFRDGFQQTSVESLNSRGIYPDVVRGVNMDPGLRREWVGMTSSTWNPGGRPKVKVITPNTRSRRPAAPSANRARRPAPPPVNRPRLPAASPAPAPKPAPSRAARRRRSETVAPDATITLAAEREASGIDELLTALESQLIGLRPVKKRVEQIGSLLLVDRARQRFELSASRPNLHMCFTGAPGTGKTTVALTMADLLYRLGYLERGHVVHAMRDDLVGEFIGQTAPKTHSVLSRAMGGVLFIDEAYSLFRDNDSKDYGQECVDILLQVMENQRDELVVILAGYKDRMDVFFESNPGMRSRVAHHLDFVPYQVDELLQIGELMLDRSSYYLSSEAKATFRDYLSAAQGQPGFANARSVRNALEAARFRHARRLVEEPQREWTRDDLMRLEPTDILPARA